MKKRERDKLARRAAEALGPMNQYAKSCHAASLVLVRAGIGTRVARGICSGVGAQHSWVVFGEDCFDPSALIVDPTLWSYDPAVKGVWVGDMLDERHQPHGYGSILDWGLPVSGGGKIVHLTPKAPFSMAARHFLELVEPLDLQGWARLAHAPVKGWPAAEIIAAMDDTDGLGVHIPIDILGMLTDRNPCGVYR